MGKIVSGITGALGLTADPDTGRGAQEQAGRFQQQAANELKKLVTPDIESQRVQLDTGDLVLSQLAEKLGPSALASLQIDPRLAEFQERQLAQMQEAGEEGFSEEDRARIEMLRQRLSGDQAARLASIQQGMAQRGALDSGMQLAAQLSSSQGAAERARQQGLQLAAEQAAARRGAVAQAGQLAGQMEGRRFSQEAQKGSAADRIKAFNAGVAQRDTAARRGHEQALAATRNQQQLYNKGLIAQKYQQQVQRAGGVAGALGNQAALASQQAGMQAQAAQQQAAGVRGILGTAGKMFAAEDGGVKRNFAEGGVKSDGEAKSKDKKSEKYMPDKELQELFRKVKLHEDALSKAEDDILKGYHTDCRDHYKDSIVDKIKDDKKFADGGLGEQPSPDRLGLGPRLGGQEMPPEALQQIEQMITEKIAQDPALVQQMEQNPEQAEQLVLETLLKEVTQGGREPAAEMPVDPSVGEQLGPDTLQEPSMDEMSPQELEMLELMGQQMGESLEGKDFANGGLGGYDFLSPSSTPLMSRELDGSQLMSKARETESFDEMDADYSDRIPFPGAKAGYGRGDSPLQDMQDDITDATGLRDGASELPMESPLVKAGVVHSNQQVRDRIAERKAERNAKKKPKKGEKKPKKGKKKELTDAEKKKIADAADAKKKRRQDAFDDMSSVGQSAVPEGYRPATDLTKLMSRDQADYMAGLREMAMKGVQYADGGTEGGERIEIPESFKPEDIAKILKESEYADGGMESDITEEELMRLHGPQSVEERIPMSDDERVKQEIIRLYLEKQQEEMRLHNEQAALEQSQRVYGDRVYGQPQEFADGGMNYEAGGEGTIIDSGQESYAGDQLDDNINDGEMVLNLDQQDHINDLLQELAKYRRGDEAVAAGEATIGEGQQDALMEVMRDERAPEELPEGDVVQRKNKLLEMLGME